MLYQVIWAYNMQDKGGPFRVIGDEEACNNILCVITDSVLEERITFLEIRDLDGNLIYHPYQKEGDG